MELSEYTKTCTEKHLFVCIYSLGGFIWQVNHDLYDGRYDSTPETKKWLIDSQKTMQSMVGCTSRFGVILPLDDNNCATPDYWDWYYRMKKWWFSLPQDEQDLIINKIDQETR